MTQDVVGLVENDAPEIVVVIENQSSDIVISIQDLVPDVVVNVEDAPSDTVVVVDDSTPDVNVVVSEVGIVGPRGPQGPAGPPGSGGTGSDSSGILLTGYGRPVNDSGLAPLDGVHDPWRLFIAETTDAEIVNQSTAWASPMTEVAWESGATPPSVTWNGEGLRLKLVFTYAQSFLDYYNGQGDKSETVFTYAQDVGWHQDANYPESIDLSLFGDAVDFNWGVNAFLVWYTNGDETVAFPPEVPDLSTILGPEFTLGDEFPIVEKGTGEFGNLYINKLATNDSGTIDSHVFEMWGPKDPIYGWGNQPVKITGISTKDYHLWWPQLFGPDARDLKAPPITISNSERPPDNYLGYGAVSLWVDDSDNESKIWFSTVGVDGTRYDHTVGTGDTGAPGPPGEVVPFEYQMPNAQTTAVINHTLGHDPVACQVFDNGQLCDEYSVIFTIPDQQVTIGFDVSVAAFIRLF